MLLVEFRCLLNKKNKITFNIIVWENNNFVNKTTLVLLSKKKIIVTKSVSEY